MKRDLNTMFAYECRRDPALAALAAQAASMSDEEIAQAPVKLPWMRAALRTIKQQATQQTLAEQVEPLIADGVLDDPVGCMRVWIGPSRFVAVGRTALEVREGQLLWLNDNGVWFDTIFAATVPPEVETNTRIVAHVTRTAYYEAVRVRLTALPTNTAVERQPAFRIYRPSS